ncbi:MAG: hypothetical protein AAF721_01640 [Myxococcota bacterium]
MRRFVVVLALGIGCSNPAPRQDPAPKPTSEKPKPGPSLPASPGRVAIIDTRADMAERMRYVSVTGEAEAQTFPETVHAVPYREGSMLMAQDTARQLSRVTLAGKRVGDDEWVSDLTLVAASPDGDTLLLEGYDYDRRTPETALWDLPAGKGALARASDPKRCMWSDADLAPDRPEVVLTCKPCDCRTTEPKCRVDLCRLEAGRERVSVVSTKPGGHRSPRYAWQGRLVFGTARRDTSAACVVDPNKCRFDTVWTPAANPAASATLVAENALPRAASRNSGRVLLATARAEEKKSPVVSIADLDGDDAVTLREGRLQAAPREAFSFDDQWVTFAVRVEGPPSHRGASKTSRSRAVVCRVDGTQCVDLGAGVPVGWVADATPSEAEPPVTGCWRVDVDALNKTNEIPPDMRSRRFDEIFAGFGFHFTEEAVGLWLRTEPEGVHFALEFPAVIDVAGPDVIVQLSAPSGLPEPGAAPPQGKMPPLRLHHHARKIIFKRGADGELESRVNVLLKALWGKSFGPLRLLPSDCPDPLPTAGS